MFINGDKNCNIIGNIIEKIIRASWKSRIYPNLAADWQHRGHGNPVMLLYTDYKPYHTMHKIIQKNSEPPFKVHDDYVDPNYGFTGFL